MICRLKRTEMVHVPGWPRKLLMVVQRSFSEVFDDTGSVKSSWLVRRWGSGTGRNERRLGLGVSTQVTRTTVLSIGCTLVVLALSGLLYARVTGPCSDCHTMHYSQGGGTLSEWGSSGPYRALTTDDCTGCHTAPSGSQNDGNNKTPYIMSVSTPDYGTTGKEGNTLAGGSFYWMRTDAATGHNVEGIAIYFDMLPPGYDLSLPGARGPWPASQQVTCAGTYGCHGTTDTTDLYAAVKGGHHGDDSQTDGSTLAKSYRLLYGVAGKEDSNWEYQPEVDAHNQYKAVHRSGGDQTYDSTTISYLCSQCHGQFHNGTGNVGTSSPWLRHPTDVRLPGDGEYADYNEEDKRYIQTYSVIAPVGSQDVSAVLREVHPGTNDCIVTCISCHRAHGSEHYKIMRWDYRSWPGPGGYPGCGICHTTKASDLD
jgi:hypothetical protein